MTWHVCGQFISTKVIQYFSVIQSECKKKLETAGVIK